MKIQIMSDLHIEFEIGQTVSSDHHAMVQRTVETPADVVVLAGDTYTKGRGPAVASERFQGKTIIMVAGNHEYYGEVYPTHTAKIQRKADQFDNVHFLECQAVEIDDVVFLGCTLWTDLKLWETGPHAGMFNSLETVRDVNQYMTDYRRIKFYDNRCHRQLVPGNLVKRHLYSLRWLKEQFEIYRGRNIVVVTHMAPSFKSVPEAFSQDILSAAYASHLDEMVEQSGALLWIHGHIHEPCDYMIGKTRVIANPFGYPDENKRFRPDLVVDVALL